MDTTSEVMGERSRLRAAAALRNLGHAMVAHRADDAVLERVADLADELAVAVMGGPLVERTVADEVARLAEPVPPDGAVVDHGVLCPVSGHANPLGLAMTARRVGDAVHATVTLAAAAAGSPGIAHGGVVAALLDDVMGFVLDSLQRTPGYTARLEVHFRKPVPVGVPLGVRGQMRRRDGRKLFIDAVVEQHGTTLAEAEALFLAIDLDTAAALS
ncbi:PaaI family thioesterase [Sphaerisporangium sp. NPDC051017]|uniref:PaaI family thioesterase n=1 Tax=Sphaerisporangium sp. NPDC051017 TaxID=3154636 RepID=UPI003437AAE0